MKRILAIARFLLKAINSFNVKYNKTGFFFIFEVNSANRSV